LPRGAKDRSISIQEGCAMTHDEEGTPPDASGGDSESLTETEVVYERDRPLLVLRSVRLRVASGPDEGAACVLAKERVRVGTADDNDLVLADPRVSRHHVEVELLERGCRVRDLQSTNGTFYRGARVQEALLEPGAEIRIGSSVLRLERAQEQHAVAEQQKFGSLIGTSRAMQQVFGLLAAVAPTDATVLILGETGTGKELVAEEIHLSSPRRDAPFNVVDCGALPASLIESELFGHVKGAFTGAISDREGIFERTPGGTVFLDEISELPLELQTRLLRVLDRRTVTRVGTNTPLAVDVRLVAATNRDLGQEVKEGRFRQDLYYRLAVVRITLPSLRERREDIPLLARYFLERAGCGAPDAVLSEEVLRDLAARKWSGNVRELRNVMERLVVLADGSHLMEDGPSLQLRVGESAETRAFDLGGLRAVLPPEFFDQSYKLAKEQLLREFEALYIARLADRHGDNISRMARDAGVDRHIIRKLLAKHGRQA
jgi:DNA-binding NtrC family response regulator